MWNWLVAVGQRIAGWTRVAYWETVNTAPVFRRLFLAAVVFTAITISMAAVSVWLGLLVAVAEVGLAVWVATSRTGINIILAFLGADALTARPRWARKKEGESFVFFAYSRRLAHWVGVFLAAEAGLALVFALLPVGQSLTATGLLLLAILVFVLTVPASVRGAPGIGKVASLAVAVAIGSAGYLIYLGGWDYIGEKWPQHIRWWESRVAAAETRRAEEARENEVLAAEVYRETTQDTAFFQVEDEQLVLVPRYAVAKGTRLLLFDPHQEGLRPVPGSMLMAKVVGPRAFPPGEEKEEPPAKLPGFVPVGYDHELKPGPVFVPGLSPVGYVPWAHTKPVEKPEKPKAKPVMAAPVAQTVGEMQAPPRPPANFWIRDNQGGSPYVCASFAGTVDCYNRILPWYDYHVKDTDAEWWEIRRTPDGSAIPLIAPDGQSVLRIDRRLGQNGAQFRFP